MGYKRLYIWVEGDDDERLFNKVIKLGFFNNYNLVDIIKYARLRKEKIVNFLRSINSMNASYIYVADINNAPCITGKKENTQNEFKNIDRDRIIVVIKEIESWYLAGLDVESSKKLRISYFKNTDEITKEQFHNLIPEKFDSSIDFMFEILKYFSIKKAKEKNRSFRYFIEKYFCKT